MSLTFIHLFRSNFRFQTRFNRRSHGNFPRTGHLLHHQLESFKVFMNPSIFHMHGTAMMRIAVKTLTQFCSSGRRGLRLQLIGRLHLYTKRIQCKTNTMDFRMRTRGVARVSSQKKSNQTRLFDQTDMEDLTHRPKFLVFKPDSRFDKSGD